MDLGEALRVRTSQKLLEPFNRDKLLLSLYKSLSHRKTALVDARQLQETVVSTLLPMLKDGIITSTSIVVCVQDILGRFDHAGAVYYKAHYGMEDRS